MVDYQDQNIVVIGLGITGLSCVDYFLSKNVVPKVIDTRANPAGIDQLDSRVAFHLGNINLDWVLAADLLVVSPGIALSTPELVQAQQAGIEIVGDIELFCREVNQLNDKRIVAITGANGKTTVTSLVGQIVADAGIKVGVGGNIGQAVLTMLNHDYDVFVLELSSFQLETTYSLQATVATILNISEDHMDRYPQGLMQYVAAKQRIYHQAQNCVVNADDRLTYPTEKSEVNIIEFGITHGRYHLDSDKSNLMVDNQVVLDTRNMQLFGLHNYLNALVALAASDVLQISRSTSLTTIANFKGLAHRFELVHKHNDVLWINDSKATNVGSTVAALSSVVYAGKLYLLLGGDGKSADFSPLIPYLSQDNVKVFCFGRDKQQLAKLNPQVTTIVDTMQQAIEAISKSAKSGDVVLLSPACASLDQFKNYIERGNDFARLAKEYCH